LCTDVEIGVLLYTEKMWAEMGGLNGRKVHNEVEGGGYVNALVLDCYWAGKTKRRLWEGVDMQHRLR
jgi:hypothetical protein